MKKDDMYTTPIINFDGKIQSTINDMTAQLKSLSEEKCSHQERINELQRKLDLPAVHEKFSSTYHNLSKKLNALIKKDAWRMKAIIKTQKELNKVRKHQGFSRIVRAFMAIGEDPKMANISASFIQKESTNSSSTNKSSPKNATGDPTSSIAASIQPPPKNALIKNTSDDFSFGFLSGEPDLTTTQLREDFDKLQHNYQNLLQTLVTERAIYQEEKKIFTTETDIL
jgi:hypothetical protein